MPGSRNEHDQSGSSGRGSLVRSVVADLLPKARDERDRVKLSTIKRHSCGHSIDRVTQSRATLPMGQMACVGVRNLRTPISGVGSSERLKRGLEFRFPSGIDRVPRTDKRKNQRCHTVALALDFPKVDDNDVK